MDIIYNKINSLKRSTTIFIMAATNKYVEYANKAVVDKLIKMDYKQFLKINELYYNEKDDAQDFENKKKEADTPFGQFTIITELCEYFAQNDYCITTTYDRRGREECRRYAVGKSLQRLWKVYRNAILRENSVDFDMVNAHPTILLHLCEKNKIKCTQLRRYVNERDDIIDKFDEKDDISSWNGGEDGARTYIKTELFISSINWCKLRTQFPKHPRRKKITYDFWSAFNKEILEIQKKLAEIYTDEFAIVKKGGSHNLGGRLMSYLGCKHEDKLLKRIEDSGIKPSVLMYDGFLIHGSDIDVDKMIERCNSITSDYGVKWSDKFINRDVIDYITDLDVSNNNKINVVCDSCCDIARKLLLTLFKDRLYICNKKHYFKSVEGWDNDEKSINNCLIAELTENCIYKRVNGIDILLADNLTWCREVICFLLAKCEINNNLMNDIWEKTIRKIYFKNGYYDFNTHTFEENDKNSFINIPRDLTFERRPDVEKEIYRRVLNPIFTVVDGAEDYDIRVKLRDAWMTKMSRIMGGFIEDKEAVVNNGDRNCGKGVLSDAVKFAFEDYVTASNAENFSSKPNNDEEAKKNAFMYDFQFARAVMCNEVSLKENGVTKFDGNLIKKAHSGGDFIEMRQLYQNKTNVRLQATVIFNLNDVPVFHPSDTREKIIQFDYNSKFYKQKIDKEKQFTNIKYFEADDSVKTDFIKRPEVRNEFVLMLIDAFKNNAKYPDELREIQEIDYEDDNDVSCVLDLFEITKSNTDRVSNKKLKTLLKDRKMNFTVAKVIKILLGKGCDRGNSGGRYISGLIIKDKENDE